MPKNSCFQGILPLSWSLYWTNFVNIFVKIWYIYVSKIYLSNFREFGVKKPLSKIHSSLIRAEGTAWIGDSLNSQMIQEEQVFEAHTRFLWIKMYPILQLGPYILNFSKKITWFRQILAKQDIWSEMLKIANFYHIPFLSPQIKKMNFLK